MIRPPRLRPLLLLPVFAAVLLSACGTRFVSPAATVDGRPISQDDLKAELDLVLTDPQLAQQAAGPGGTQAKADFTRQALGNLIRREVAQEYADARRIVVTAQDVDDELQATIAQLGGQAQFDNVVKARGFTPAEVHAILEVQVLLRKVRDDVVARLSPPPPDNPQDRDLAFQKWLSERVAQATISVNPRFGKFDRRAGEVVALTSTADLG